MINLTSCPNVTVNVIQTIIQKSPSLEILILDKCPLIFSNTKEMNLIESLASSSSSSSLKILSLHRPPGILLGLLLLLIIIFLN